MASSNAQGDSDARHACTLGPLDVKASGSLCARYDSLLTAVMMLLRAAPTWGQHVIPTGEARIYSWTSLDSVSFSRVISSASGPLRHRFDSMGGS